MKPRFRSALPALTLTTATPAMAVTAVGGAPMTRTKDIAGSAVNSKGHAAAATAAGLVQALKGQGAAGVRQGNGLIHGAGQALIPG